jgi:mycofactocin precursor
MTVSTTDEQAQGHGGDRTPTAAGTATAAGPLVEDDLLVEDVSIDGMCGVY